MIGLGALKFFLLKVDPKKRMLFDPNESIQLAGIHRTVHSVHTCADPSNHAERLKVEIFPQTLRRS